ncbi:hypothetical protein [Burkholderia cepacia]|uniref:hypothetical protein n=1 Tax=Burkholderia cepacia TaxID=292 RepID=UPI000A834478|nr:hypothetical protein [Burkholderia cepacia]
MINKGGAIMRSGVIGWLIKAVAGVVPICALISSVAFSQEVISSRETLGTALEGAVTCRNDALNVFGGGQFDGGPSDPRGRLEALGVKITRGGDDNEKIVYRLPRGIKVFDREASEAFFSSESTTLFFVAIRSNSNRLGEFNKALRLSRVPKGNPDGYGYFDEFEVRAIRKLSDETNSPPNTIFSAVGKNKRHGYIIVGCQNLAW